MKDETPHYILFIIIGYFVTMFLRSVFLKNKKDLKKATLIGITGAVALQKYPRVSSFFTGVALYDLGEEAGLSINSAEPNGNLNGIGKIYQDKQARTESLQIGNEKFKLTFSKWEPAYYWNDNLQKMMPTLKYIVEKPFTKNSKGGIYFIRDNRKNEIIYIGMTENAKDGFERLYRHFQKDNASGLSHPAFLDVENYDIRIIELNNINDERAKLIEKFYQEKYQPIFSYRYPSDEQFERYAQEQEQKRLKLENKQNKTNEDIIDSDYVPF